MSENERNRERHIFFVCHTLIQGATVFHTARFEAFGLPQVKLVPPRL